MDTNSIADVLSGKTAVKVNVGIDLTSALILGVSLFIVIISAGIIIKKA